MHLVWNQVLRATFLAYCVATLVGAGGVRAADPLPVVDSIDFARYAGRWYEIARLPNFFQRNCAADVFAEYSLRDDGRIRVYNRCRRENGAIDDVDGVAQPVDDRGPNSRLEVSFLPRWLRWIPFTWGDYWVIELGADYDYAVVGTPSRGYLWILARTPRLDDALIDGILQRVAKLGFDAAAVQRTVQGEAAAQP